METVSTHRTGAQRHPVDQRHSPRRQLTAPAPSTVKPISLQPHPLRRRPTVHPTAVKALICAADLAAVLLAMAISQHLARLTGGTPSRAQEDSTWRLIALSLPVWIIAFFRYRLYQARFLGR